MKPENHTAINHTHRGNHVLDSLDRQTCPECKGQLQVTGKGVRHFGLHAIRHLTASILVHADVPLIDVQTILRHKKIVTTERYIHRLRSVRGSLSVLEGRNKCLSDEPANTESELSKTEFCKPA